jgi:hypothetical protein
VSGVIALVPAPVDRYPVWRWLPDTDLRVIVDAERQAAPIPVEHAAVSGGDRSVQIGAHLNLICAQHRPDRDVHLAAHDVMRAAARTLHGIEGQALSAASVFTDRALARERLVLAGIPVIPHARVDQPLSVFRFAEKYGYPVAVRPRFLQQPHATAVLSAPSQVRAWSQAGYRDDSQGWVVESAGPGRRVRIDPPDRGLPLEMPWVSVTATVLAGRCGVPVLTLPLAPVAAPGPAAVLRVLAAAMAALRDPGVALVSAELHPRAESYAVADVSCGLDVDYPRSLIDAAYGQDPVQCYVRAAAVAALEPAPEQPVHVAGRIAVPARRCRLTEVDQLPERFSGSHAHATLAEIGGRPADRRHAATLDTAAPTFARLRTELDDFADLVEDGMRYGPPLRTAA